MVTLRYLKACFLLLFIEFLNVMFFANHNPVRKTMGKVIKKAAIEALMVIPKIVISCSKRRKW